jgi:LysR family glycine cleavage system transcriptional activator
MSFVVDEKALERLVASVSVLAAVQATGSFVGAADRLGIDQSAVSHRIRTLEAELELKLFERTTRRVKPTRAGAILCDAATRARATLAGALAAAREVRAPGAVRLSLPSSVATKWLLPRLSQAIRDGLDLTLDVSEGLEDLGPDGAEVGLRFGPGPYPGQYAVRLAQSHLQPVARPDAGASSLRPGATLLADRRGEQDGTGFDWSFYLAAGGLPDLSNFTLRYFDRADLMLQAAIGGAGIALGRTLLVEADIRNGLMAPVGPMVAMKSAYWLVTSHELARSPRMDRLEKWLRRQIADDQPRA